jgi:hypothetical protein
VRRTFDDQVALGDAHFARDTREDAAAARVAHAERATLIHLARLVTTIRAHVDPDESRRLLLGEIQAEASLDQQRRIERTRHDVAPQLIAFRGPPSRVCPVLPGLALSPHLAASDVEAMYSPEKLSSWTTPSSPSTTF